jgi:membrane protease YdiL (CAAX protease family)
MKYQDVILVRTPSYYKWDRKAHMAQGGIRKSPPGGALLVVLAMLPFAAKLGAMALGPQNYLAQSLYKVFQVFAPVYWRKRFQDRRGLALVWPIEEPWPSVTTWMWAVVIAAALVIFAMGAILVLSGPLGLDPRELRAQMDARFDMTPLRAIVVVLYLLSINAAIEELHFRAWLDREISIRWGSRAGIIASAMAFGVMHTLIFLGMKGVSAVAMVLVCLALVIAGACWSLLMRRQGGIHAAWLCHGLTDAGLLTWGLHWLGYI